ncbi:MAG: protein translocase subunit SecF [Provencibacterium sp.]|jgi:preprotein translocase subunit SecF|nr:protein translocase subunit SecF [Provencibacterium sp.]
MKLGTIDFMKNKKIYFVVSICLVVLTLLSAVIVGVNLDIQFKGGTILTYSHSGELNAADFQKTVEAHLGQSVKLQEQTNVATGETNYVVSLTSTDGLTLDEQGALTDAITAAYPDNGIETVSVNNVNPTIGSEFFRKCLVAVTIAALLMVVYIAFRFRRIGGWSAGVMCVVALLHDTMIVFLTFVLCRFPINDNFIAVVLTILGYSINATIVVYDRVRENEKRFGRKADIGDVVNTSINQSLTRAMNTTITTATAMLVICIVALTRGVSSILSFAFPLLIGILAGFYSSVCLSGPLWVTWQRYYAARKKAAKA